MIITNNVIVVHKNNDKALLLEAMGTIKEYLVNNSMGEYEFVETTQFDFPAFLVPEGITYEDMVKALGDENVRLRAINEDSFVYSYSRIREYRHDYTPEELGEIADEVMRTKQEIREKLSEKALAAKKLAAEIEQLQEKEDMLCHKHIARHTYKEVTCKVVYDFVNKQKIFTELNTGRLIEVEPMESRDLDFQVKHRLEQTFMPMDVEIAKKKKVSGSSEETFTEKLTNTEGPIM